MPRYTADEEDVPHRFCRWCGKDDCANLFWSSIACDAQPDNPGDLDEFDEELLGAQLREIEREFGYRRSSGLGFLVDHQIELEVFGPFNNI